MRTIGDEQVGHSFPVCALVFSEDMVRLTQ